MSLMVFGVACGEPTVAPIDGGADAGPGLVVAAPVWGPCPSGWAEQAFEGATVCAPPARVACEGATFQPLGSAACEPIDDACATGRFRSPLPADRPFLYVDASAAAGGDGTEAFPFQTLDDAIDHARGANLSTVGIALAAGDYTQGRALPTDVVIAGACASGVRLVGPTGGAAVLVAPAAHASLEGVTLTGEGFGLASRGHAILHDVFVDGARPVGIGLLGGTVELRRVRIRGTRTATDGTFGRGLSLSMGAHATLEDVVVEDSRDSGLSVEGATLEGTRVVVQGVVPNDLGRFGVGVSGFGGASITLHDAWVGGAAVLGVESEASSVTLDRVVIDGESGNGLGAAVSAAGTLTLTRAWIDDTAGSAVTGLDAMSAMTASDLVVTGTRPRDGSGAAIGATTGAHLTLTRAAVLDTTSVGVMILESRLDAEDLLVRHVTEAGRIGDAVLVGQGSSATIERFELSHAQGVAAMVTTPETSATLRHGLIHDVDLGVAFDVGRGVEVDYGATVVLEDVVVRGVIESGIVAYGDGNGATSITMDGVLVEDIRERPCVTTTCPTEGGGTAVTALGGGAIQARDLTVDGAPLCGVQIAEGGSLDVTRGTIRRSAIGACVQVEGYDLSRILDGVAFVDDERNLETTSVYVPPPAPSP